MEEQEINRIFSRFVQANHRTYSEYGGSGLGLFICKNLIQLMGGTINVESVKNKGTKFTFTVPCTRVETEIVITSATKKRRPSPAIDPLQRKRYNILIVEDNL
jgi:K+-sensing histidine kinase KdpD